MTQGMANSPTMCQLYVDAALYVVRQEFPRIKCYHYMDDVLLAAPMEEMLDLAYSKTIQQLQKVIHYLGSKITERYITPQKIQIRTDHLRTLNDFQKLLGDSQWVWPYLGLTNKQLQPLYDFLPGVTALDSERVLTKEGRETLKLVEKLVFKLLL